MAKEIIKYSQANKKSLLYAKDLNLYLKSRGYDKGIRKRARLYLTKAQLAVSLEYDNYLLIIDEWLKLSRKARYKLLKPSWIPYIKYIMKRRFFDVPSTNTKLDVLDSIVRKNLEMGETAKYKEETVDSFLARGGTITKYKTVKQ